YSVLQMGLIGVSNKGYPVLSIPKGNKIKFALTKIQASPLAKIKYDRIKWQGIGDKNNQLQIQTHHIATDKSKKYTPKFQEILNLYGLKLNENWNKVKMPHRGRHPNEYHEYILEKMNKIDKIARGDKNKFLKEFEKLKEEIKNNPAILRKEYYKEKK
ncbi:AHH domain-containing protein, partial [Campylobacter taeniopygiae]|uniref:AHH domain-containing protein n=1 Tax=Campylobacter taeniopygiae TaxID=2510188 RepID=UPI003D69FFC4